MGRINDNKKVLKELQNLFKQAGKKYSIRVGIIGDKASQMHEDSGLTNAELGAIHEFGATIEHPGGQPYFINEKGQAVFVKKDSELGKKLIAKGQVTKAHTIIIPTRSFLRMPLLSSDGQKRIMLYAEEELGGEISSDKFVNEYLYGSKLSEEGFMGKVANKVGEAALGIVQEAFDTGGFDKWAPITTYTKNHRKHDPENPPLQDSGDLMDSITVEVKKVK